MLCPSPARLRHPAMSAPWSLTGGKRTWRGQPNSVENDPQQTETDFAAAVHMCRSRKTYVSVRL
jgi:hypothetical protein